MASPCTLALPDQSVPESRQDQEQEYIPFAPHFNALVATDWVIRLKRQSHSLTSPHSHYQMQCSAFQRSC